MKECEKGVWGRKGMGRVGETKSIEEVEMDDGVRRGRKGGWKDYELDVGAG